MRRLVRRAAIAALGLGALLGLGVLALRVIDTIPSAHGQADVVPPRIAAAMRDRVAAPIAMTPTWVPRGFHFLRWDTGEPPSKVRPSPLFEIWFYRHGGLQQFQSSLGANVSRPAPELSFSVWPAKGECSGALARRTYHVGSVFSSVGVYWTGGERDQQAWRCATLGGTRVFIQASETITGDASQPHDPGDLARIVASAQAIP
jgi:hypothetical protein